MRNSFFRCRTVLKFSFLLFLFSLLSLISCNKEENQVAPDNVKTGSRANSMSPYVKIISPLNGSKVRANTSFAYPWVEVEASSPLPFVRVELWVNGQKVSEKLSVESKIPTYNLPWKNVIKGKTYELKAVAIDQLGHRFTSTPFLVSSVPSFSLFPIFIKEGTGISMDLSFDSHYSNIKVEIRNSQYQIVYSELLGSGRDFKIPISSSWKAGAYYVFASGTAEIPLPLTIQRFNITSDFHF